MIIIDTITFLSIMSITLTLAFLLCNLVQHNSPFSTKSFFPQLYIIKTQNMPGFIRFTIYHEKVDLQLLLHISTPSHKTSSGEQTTEFRDTVNCSFILKFVYFYVKT